MSARPPVQAIRSAAWASEREVGLDSGMMTGRSVYSAISVTIGSENAPGWVEVPISMVGRVRVTTSARPMRPSASRSQPATSAAVLAYGTWKSRSVPG